MQNLIDLAAAVSPIVLWIFAVIAGIIAVLTFFAVRKAYRAIRKRTLEDVLTIVAAGIATGVSAQGMWRFTGDVLGFDGPMQWLLFAFIEVAVITSAVRARRNIRAGLLAGVDGLAVWVLTGLTAVLSSMDARSLAEGIFRLAAPLVAAWLWERGMAVERHRLTGLTGINWRITPERLLVRIGLAEARGRTASDVDAHRRLTRAARAAKRLHVLQAANTKPRKLLSASARLDAMVDQAIEHAELADDPRRQAQLLDRISALFGAAGLARLPETVAPWQHIDHPAVTGAARNSEAAKLAGALDEWTTAIEREHDPEVSAAVTSMAAYIAGRNLPYLGDATEVRQAPAVPVVAPAVLLPSGVAPTPPTMNFTALWKELTQELNLPAEPGDEPDAHPAWYVPAPAEVQPYPAAGQQFSATLVDVPEPRELYLRAVDTYARDGKLTELPAVQTIKKELGCGQTKAQQVQTYLRELVTEGKILFDAVAYFSESSHGPARTRSGVDA